MKKYVAYSLLALTLFSTSAYADQQAIRAMEESKITLTEAIKFAEKSQNGKAFEASIDDDSFRPAYEVSIIKDNKVFDVQVDALDGSIIGAREDFDD